MRSVMNLRLIYGKKEKTQCQLRNSLLEKSCAKCGHLICKACLKVAQRENMELGEIERDMKEEATVA
jgi:hypothetical protein